MIKNIGTQIQYVGTKAFLKGWKLGLFVHFVQLPCSWIRIRLPKLILIRNNYLGTWQTYSVLYTETQSCAHLIIREVNSRKTVIQIKCLKGSLFNIYEQIRRKYLVGIFLKGT